MPKPNESALQVRVGTGVDAAVAIDPVLAKHAEGARLVAAQTTKQGTALELSYLIRLKPNVAPLALLSELNRTEGVQGVEWKDAEKK